MSLDLLQALFRRRSTVDAQAEVYESVPIKSLADAAHLEHASFDAPSLEEWLAEHLEGPEEDIVADLLAKDVESRGVRPCHAPRPLDGDRLQSLAEVLDKLKQKLNSGKVASGLRFEEILLLETEVRMQEEKLAAERDRHKRNEEALQNYPAPQWLERLDGTINIGVVGNSGVGKSLLINVLRNMRSGQEGWSPVGVNETTKAASMYPFPNEPRVRLWDCPGTGTPAFPLETYVAGMGLRYFDAVLIVSAGRFTQAEITLKNELEEHQVPYYMVRTKIDIDVANNKADNGANEQITTAQINDELRRRHGIDRVYLVSLRDRSAFDFPVLLGKLFPSLAKVTTDLENSPEDPNTWCEAWKAAWSMPEAYSKLVSCLQGRWKDHQGSFYLVRGLEVHVTTYLGQTAVVQMLEDSDAVWWQHLPQPQRKKKRPPRGRKSAAEPPPRDNSPRWFVDHSAVDQICNSNELRWEPGQEGFAPFVWRWHN